MAPRSRGTRYLLSLGPHLYVFLQTCCEVDKDLAAVCAFLMTVTMRVAAYTYRRPYRPIPIRSGRTGARAVAAVASRSLAIRRFGETRRDPPAVCDPRPRRSCGGASTAGGGEPALAVFGLCPKAAKKE